MSELYALCYGIHSHSLNYVIVEIKYDAIFLAIFGRKAGARGTLCGMTKQR